MPERKDFTCTPGTARLVVTGYAPIVTTVEEHLREADLHLQLALAVCPVDDHQARKYIESARGVIARARKRGRPRLQAEELSARAQDRCAVRALMRAGHPRSEAILMRATERGCTYGAVDRNCHRLNSGE
jgi:hypothetical protein